MNIRDIWINTSSKLSEVKMDMGTAQSLFKICFNFAPRKSLMGWYRAAEILAWLSETDVILTIYGREAEIKKLVSLIRLEFVPSDQNTWDALERKKKIVLIPN